MRHLLDECIDEGLRHHFIGHECQTCRYAGLTGLANGELLAAAEQAGFEVLITVDQNMPSQQSLRGRSISLLEPSASLESPISGREGPYRDPQTLRLVAAKKLVVSSPVLLLLAIVKRIGPAIQYHMAPTN